MQLTSKQKKQIFYVIVAVMALSVFSMASDILLGLEQVKEGILRGNKADEIYQGDFKVRLEDGRTQDITVSVYPKKLSEAQGQVLLNEAVTEFEAVYLGDNLSANQVWHDLCFPQNLCDEMVQATYESDVPELIWEDGSVACESVGEQGQLVTIKALFSCQDYQLEYVCYVRVVPPVLSQDEQLEKELLDIIEQTELSSRDNLRFVLPTEWQGQNLVWKKKLDAQPLIFMLLGMVAIVCIVQKSKQDQRQKKQMREHSFVREYPQMVTQLSLLMGAGMTISTAWGRLVKRYLEQQVESEDKEKEKRLYLEEMLITYREIKEGKGIRAAYEDFGRRVGLTSYRKLSALLLQNLDKGNRDIVHVMDQEAETAIEEQKRNIRQQGEEAGTKLLFPMLLLFLMILIMIMVPAMQSF